MIIKLFTWDSVLLNQECLKTYLYSVTLFPHLLLCFILLTTKKKQKNNHPSCYSIPSSLIYFDIFPFWSLGGIFLLVRRVPFQAFREENTKQKPGSVFWTTSNILVSCNCVGVCLLILHRLRLWYWSENYWSKCTFRQPSSEYLCFTINFHLLIIS